MKRFAALACAFLFAAIPLAAAEPGDASCKPAPEAAGASQGFGPYRRQARETAAEIICYCGCDRMTLAECVCGVAMKELARIEGLLAEGKSRGDIVALYVQEHGEEVKATPDAAGFHLAVWILPFAATLLALGVLAWALRRPARGTTPAAAPPTAGPSGERKRKAEEALNRYDF